MASTYFVLRKIIEEYHLDEILGDIIGKIFLDKMFVFDF